MFIAGAHLEGKDYLLVLGLSAENLRRLKAGKPMDISRASHGLVVPEGLKIVIFTGETEETMRAAMASLIGPDTVVDQKRPL